MGARRSRTSYRFADGKRPAEQQESKKYERAHQPFSVHDCGVLGETGRGGGVFTFTTHRMVKYLK